MNHGDERPHVVVLGASPKPHRFSHRAVRLLLEHRYRVSPVHPRADEVSGLPVHRTLATVPSPVHTVTVYVSPVHLEEILSTLVDLAPRRVIFNPGSGSQMARQRLTEAGIPWGGDCTLGMLGNGSF